MTDDLMRRRLLALARAALEARVRGTTPPAVPRDLDLWASGAFVSIHHRGELRGCLGALEPRLRIASAVANLAADVAHRDPRFDALRVSELADVAIDLSILTPPEEVRDLSEIVVGRDGLIVEQGRHRGLLLPQVATEHGWDRETFLAHTCRKAGLAADAWRHGAAVYRFEAEVVKEG